jgi:very-short-patch-repair endonuclease
LFLENSLGVLSKNDDVTISFDKSTLKKRIENFISLPESEVKKLYNIKEDSRDWILSKAITDLKDNNREENYKHIAYRPFDNRWTFFTGKPKGFFAYSQNRIMKNLKSENNFALITGRQGQAVGNMQWNLSFISNTISDQNIYYRGGGSVFPLYIYPDTNAQQTIDTSPNPSEGGELGRVPNLNAEIVNQLAEKLGLRFTNEKETQTSPNPSKGGGQEGSSKNSAVEEQVIQRPGYITANLHNYPYIKDIREKLKENQTEAEKLIWGCLRNKKTGHKIRRQHIIDNFITDFVCLPKKVVIEIDGGIHLEQKEQDELRTFTLNEKGYKVIRFTNEEVFADAELVARKIKEVLDNRETVLNDDESENPFLGEDVLSPSFGGVRGGQISGEDTFAPIDILDYIYAVLHSPTYREKYKEFLKIDFPRVPYPKDVETFWQLVKLGGEIRQIHLLESPTVEKYITQYPIDGNNVVEKPRFEMYEYEQSLPDENGNIEYPDYLGAVYINETQYFADVPSSAWNFYIGGYQPAQKWLKDRKGRALGFEDILHYQKIIVALSETDRIMKEIDKIEII